MSVIHSPKRKKYTSISNQLAENENLTFTARGLALYLLCKPENWKIQISDLLKRGGLRKTDLRKAMIELERTGYLVFYRIFGGRGSLKSFWQMFEDPVNPSERSRSWENQAQRLDSNPHELSSPESKWDVLRCDVSRGDIVNTHDTNYPESKDSLGDISPLCDKESQIHPFLLRTPESQNSQPISPISEGDAIASPVNQAGPVPIENTHNHLVRDGADNHAAQGALFAQNCPPLVSRSNGLGESSKIESTPVSVSKRPISATAGSVKKSVSETDPRATHPAIVAFRDIVLKFPKKPVWDQIIAIIGDNPDKLKLEKCYVEAMMRGPWCANGYKWVEWYRDGIPEFGVKPKRQKEVSKYDGFDFTKYKKRSAV